MFCKIGNSAYTTSAATAGGVPIPISGISSPNTASEGRVWNTPAACNTHSAARLCRCTATASSAESESCKCCHSAAYQSPLRASQVCQMSAMFALPRKQIRHQRVFRLAHNPLGRIGAHHFALIQNTNPVGQTQRLFHVVGNKYHR